MNTRNTTTPYLFSCHIPFTASADLPSHAVCLAFSARAAAWAMQCLIFPICENPFFFEASFELSSAKVASSRNRPTMGQEFSTPSHPCATHWCSPGPHNLPGSAGRRSLNPPSLPLPHTLSHTLTPRDDGEDGNDDEDALRAVAEDVRDQYGLAPLAQAAANVSVMQGGAMSAMGGGGAGLCRRLLVAGADIDTRDKKQVK